MSRITAKGQVTIPKQVRDDLGLKAGDEVEFFEERGVFYVRKKLDLEALRAVIEKYGPLMDRYDRRDPDELFEEMRGRKINEVEFGDDGSSVGATAERSNRQS